MDEIAVPSAGFRCPEPEIRIRFLDALVITISVGQRFFGGAAKKFSVLGGLFRAPAFERGAGFELRPSAHDFQLFVAVGIADKVATSWVAR